MAHYEYILFDTPLGRCGLAWGPAGLRAASFAHESDAATIQHLIKRAPDAVPVQDAPPEIARLIEDIIALFEGAKRDLSYAALDTDGIEPFERSVIELTKRIGPGALKTYGDLARALGDVGYSRRVGQALGRNPFPIVVPCHRVVGAVGAMTGFSAPGGADLKRRLLKIEGALEPELFD
ncbi:methylated-DNA--[protein]-cysteine S-methyltransferase [Hyphococcus flavus]|uniref:Methylated-DNA--[protein]-cysteine S-methyltransferase n=1 Tax=Hyphococcus flavus TaxID=1866326 RepID=A0AAE9ZDQ9_9PROT|nr:methylated-DNA--[protein]-cysteine S-methyltransferase [Hyphococcus flavus]WDI33129.1 methylated-DNA--[protein]-cysteine S-methyltransferase [Hyphococcus flavus]